MEFNTEIYANLDTSNQIIRYKYNTNNMQHTFTTRHCVTTLKT
jgi:hypothetical protein